MLKLIITEDNLNNTRVCVGLPSQDHVKILDAVFCGGGVT